MSIRKIEPRTPTIDIGRWLDRVHVHTPIEGLLKELGTRLNKAGASDQEFTDAIGYFHYKYRANRLLASIVNRGDVALNKTWFMGYTTPGGGHLCSPCSPQKAIASSLVPEGGWTGLSDSNKGRPDLSTWCDECGAMIVPGKDVA